jgi:fimbrial isopeptide formation D2 family protein/LPXTG-motif cell wall-anchored protein
MKKTAKILAVLLALAMVLSLGITAFAATVTNEIDPSADDASITVTLPTNQGEVANNTYKIYKVFDASVDPETGAITYQTNAATLPAGFVKDAQGNVTYDNANGDGEELTADDIAAIAAWVTNNGTLAATVTTVAGDTEFTVEDLPYGYYYITTTTGSLVTVTSTNPNAEVEDKNDVPPVDKIITKSNGGTTDVDAEGKNAMAQVGTTVDFEATITVKKGALNYKFHDTMTSGLTYNNDAVVTVNGQTVTAGPDTFSMTSTDQGDTFTITFVDSYVQGLVANDSTDDDVITITYTATVNSDALETDEENNTAKLSYGDTHGENWTPEEEVTVYDATISVYKYVDAETTGTDAVSGTDALPGQPLAGAGFVLKNAAGKYYKLDNGIVTWVDSINDATEYVTDDTGYFANGDKFTGLASGTYTLEEKTVPAGYNKAEDTPVTIAANDYNAGNLVQIAEVENESGATLPSTGGIGTTIFYVVGSLLVVGAAIVLIVRRRTHANATVA